MADLTQVIPVAALVSASVTIAIRWLDRPRAALRLEARMTSNAPETSGGTIHYGSLINTGNGDAFDVRLYGSNLDVAVPSRSDQPDGHTRMYSHRIAVVKAGETIRVPVGVPGSLTSSDPRAVLVTWSWIAALRLRRCRRFELTKTPTEMFLPPSILPTVHLRWWERSTWWLERRVPRADYSRGTRKHRAPADNVDEADDDT